MKNIIVEIKKLIDGLNSIMETAEKKINKKIITYYHLLGHLYAKHYPKSFIYILFTSHHSQISNTIVTIILQIRKIIGFLYNSL